MICIRPKVRVATNDDTPAIQKILGAAELLVQGLDWSDIGDTWLIAEHKGKPVAVCQYLPGKPLGCINVLAVDTEYQNSGVGVVLAWAAEYALGCEGSCGYLSWVADPKWLNRNRLTDLGEVHSVVKLVRRYDLQKVDNRHRNQSRPGSIFG